MGFKAHALPIMWLLVKITATTMMVLQRVAAQHAWCDEVDACEADAVCGECWAIGETVHLAFLDCIQAYQDIFITDCNYYLAHACCQHLVSPIDCLGNGLFLEAWYCTLDVCAEGFQYPTEWSCAWVGVDVVSGDGGSGAAESPAPTAVAAAPVAAPTAVETVEAGEATTVTVSANAFDMRTDDDVGCAPDGCTAENTRDGGLDDVSRWSCSSELVAERGGAAGEECQIVYEFYEAQVVRSVAIAFLKGDARTRTVNVNVNGVIHTMIESGGITSDLETFELIDTQGVLSIGLESIGLAADEFLSIIEVDFQVSSVAGAPTVALSTPAPSAFTSSAPVTPAPPPTSSAPAAIVTSPPVAASPPATAPPTPASSAFASSPAPVATVVSPRTGAPAAAITTSSAPITQVVSPGPTATTSSARDVGLTPSPTAEGAATTAGSDVPTDDVCLACMNDEDCLECVTVGIESEAEHARCLGVAGDGVCDAVFASLCCTAAVSGSNCMAMGMYVGFVSCAVQDSECSIEDMDCTGFLNAFGTDGNGAGATTAPTAVTSSYSIAVALALVAVVVAEGL